MRTGICGWRAPARTASVVAVLALASPSAFAGGANDTKTELLAWAHDGLAFVVKIEMSLAGPGESKIEVRGLGDASPDERAVCAGECTARGVRVALARGRLSPRGTAPAGAKGRVRRKGPHLVYEIEVAGRWHALGRTAVPRGTMAYSFRLLGLEWAPTGHVVAFKTFDRTNWGVENEDDTAERYRAFALPAALARALGVRGLTRDRGIWRGRSVEITTTSTLFEGSPLHYRPRNLLSGPWPWCEGAKGGGEGSTIVFRLDRPTRISGIRVRPGFHRSDALFRQNNRVMVLHLQPDRGPGQLAVFPDARQVFTVRLSGGPRTVGAITFTLKGIYTGTSSRSHDTCITELVPF